MASVRTSKVKATLSAMEADVDSPTADMALLPAADTALGEIRNSAISETA
jgi:hypothetical protein